jgi:mannose-6-phosphate isomerase-like protein (cupin superfamily)
MNTSLTTLDPVASATRTKSILAKNGFECSIITLAPGDETPQRVSHHVEEHILVVLDGEATVQFGDLNTMLKKDEALLISKGQAHLLAAGPNGWAKLLRVDVPPRQVVTPQILTVDR